MPMSFSRRFVTPALALVQALLVCFATLLVSCTATAAPKVEDLAKQLRTAKDSRVRVQAALALGVSKSPQAVTPLCGGLTDANAIVRTAAAAGLGRLGIARGSSCLQKRMSVEKNAKVKSQITRSLKQIKDATANVAAASLARKPDAKTRWYVAIAPVRNKGNRSENEINQLVQSAMRTALLANDQVALAPPAETTAQAKKILTGLGVQGYLLKPTVDAPVYAGDKLTVRISFVLMTYPGLVMKGEISPKMIQDGTPKTDVESENELIKLATERAASRFITIAETNPQ